MKIARFVCSKPVARLVALLIAFQIFVLHDCATRSEEPFAKDGILLFNGKDLDGWRKETGEWMAAGSLALDSNDPKRFALKEGTGILVNGRTGKTVNLITEREFGDIEAHIEFCVPKASNSGVYFM